MERALSVTLITDQIKRDNWGVDDTLSEFNELIRSARVRPEKGIVCNLKEISPTFLLGKGKLEEIQHLIETLGLNVVIFSENLSGTQQKNIENRLNIKTIDRTQLILDIFARRARSSEGKIQVELAQLEYLLPRLMGKGIILSRLGGGIGTRGPGEQKLEIDRRRIRTRINKLKKDLNALVGQRSMRRKKRERFSALTVAIIGYTNAGKSTLLNMLTASDILVDNMLFSTLDPTIRKYTLPNNQNVLFVDTVGFIYKLPHHLIEAFKATLEEVVKADILLHVLDMSHPKIKEQCNAAYKVLEELQIKDKPVITVLNKIDKVRDPLIRKRLFKEFRDAIAVSALYKQNADELIDKIMLHFGRDTQIVKINIPRDNMKLLHYIYEHGKVMKRVEKASSVYIEAQVPQRVMKRINTASGN